VCSPHLYVTILLAVEGGAVFGTQDSVVEITRSDFSNTTAEESGGAISSAAEVFIESSSFNGNKGKVFKSHC
jgi:predicted outer membrane repeat protein